MRILTAVCLSALACAGANAQTIVIQGAHIHTLTSQGSVREGTLVLRDGIIEAIGVDPRVPDDAITIDASGQVVTPGLVHAISQLGITEVSLEASTVDFAQAGDAELGASFSVEHAINPASTLISLARSEGISHAMLSPAARAVDGRTNIFGGTGVGLSLGAASDGVLASTKAVFVTLGSSGGSLAGGSRARALQTLKLSLADARDYRQNKAAYESGARRDYSVSHTDLETLVRVLEGELPLVVSVNRASDIRKVVQLASSEDVGVIIAGGAEAWQVSSELAVNNIPVVVDALRNLPANFDSLNATLENAARLSAAGVTVIIGEGNSHNAGNLKQNAGNAVANGMTWIDGLAAITRGPAEAFGMPDNVGALVVGQRANLVLWDGDPLDVSSFAERVWIDGQEVDRTSRQTLLRDRYHPENPRRHLPPAYR